MKLLRSLGIIAAASALVLAGCSNDDQTPSESGDNGDTGNQTEPDANGDDDADGNGDDDGAANGGESYAIGLTQIVGHPALDATAEGVKRAFVEAGVDVEWNEQNAQNDQSTAVTIASTFASADLDLVVAIATPSAQAAVQAIADVPIVFSAVTDPVAAELVDSLEAPGANVTGTTDANPVKEQLELLLSLAPDVKRVGIVYSSGEVNSISQVEWAKDAAAELGLEIVEATVSASSEVQQAAASLDVDAFYTPTDNTVISALEALLTVAEDRSIPVVSADTDSVERGTVASFGIDYEALGFQTGQMALRILQDGEDPASMPIETLTDLELKINLDAAARMGIEVPADLLAQADPENIFE